MAVGAASPDLMMGGSFSNGPAKGVYRGIINEASIKETQKGGNRLVLEVFGKNDPRHPEKEGKKIFSFSQTFPDPKGDKDKQDTVRGIWKRFIFDGLGLPWSKEAKAFDPRQCVGKEAWFLVDEKKQADGSMRNDVVGVAQEEDKLPKQTNRANGTVTEPAKGGGRRR